MAACVCADVTAFVGTPTFLRAFTVNRWVHRCASVPPHHHRGRWKDSGPKFRKHSASSSARKSSKATAASETTPVGSVNTENILLDDYLTMQVNCKPGTVGMPLPGTLYKVVDPDTNVDLPMGEDGMILVGGCQVMKGYPKIPTIRRMRSSNSKAAAGTARATKPPGRGTDSFTIVDRYSHLRNSAADDFAQRGRTPSTIRR